MKKQVLIIIGVVVIIAIGAAMAFWRSAPSSVPENINAKTPTSAVNSEASPTKAYVALEGEGVVAVIDTTNGAMVSRIDLTVRQGADKVTYMPHNVQVAPDGKSVWVTANAMDEEKHKEAAKSMGEDAMAERGEVKSAAPKDQVIVVDPSTNTIVKRIDLGQDLHLSHVALTPDSNIAIVAAQQAGMIYKVNTKTFGVEKTVETTKGAEPHGMRISPDSAMAYVAFVEGNGLGILDIGNFTLRDVPLNGRAMQTAVTPDGRYVLVSIYDKKSVAVYDPKDQSVSYISLPSEAKGPVQLYPTPDSKFVYVADQGYYFNQPTGSQVYKINISERSVVRSITAGSGPHGAVVSKDGRRVYVTNLLSGDVSVIDTSSDEVVTTMPVGKKPNGISLWSSETGGTP